MTSISDDLSIRARRGELDEHERAQFAVLLGQSVETQLAHRAGCEFDAVDRVLPGDEEVARRITERVLGAPPPNVPLTRAGWLKPVVLSLMLAGAGASVGLWRSARPPVVASPARVVLPSAPALAAAPAPVPCATSAAAELSDTAVNATPVTPEPAAPRRSLAKPAPSTPPGETATDVASLFAQANLARRTHDLPLAQVLYQRVVREFSASGQAQASTLALGSMALNAGDANTALHQFEAYLASAPRGALAADAWWGRTRALSALGRDAEAARSASELVRQFPDSPYATRARARIGVAH